MRLNEELRRLIFV